MPQLKLPRGWNKRVQSAILQAISLGRHCFFLIVGRLARSPRALDRAVAETERLRHEVELLREELRLKEALLHVCSGRADSIRRTVNSESVPNEALPAQASGSAR